MVMFPFNFNLSRDLTIDSFLSVAKRSRGKPSFPASDIRVTIIQVTYFITIKELMSPASLPARS
jgi:hypothetical protein